MEPFARLLLRLALLFRHPPSPTRLKVMLAALAICLVIVLLDRVFGHPDWMNLNPRGHLWRAP